MRKESPNYYSILTAKVRYDERLSANAKLLYSEITALSNKHGKCWASNNYFANLFSVNVSTPSKWIKQLKDYGYIDVEYIYASGSKEVKERIIRLTESIDTSAIGTAIKQGGIDIKSGGTAIKQGGTDISPIGTAKREEIILNNNNKQNSKPINCEEIEFQNSDLEVNENMNTNIPTILNLFKDKEIEQFFQLDEESKETIFNKFGLNGYDDQLLFEQLLFKKKRSLIPTKEKYTATTVTQEPKAVPTSTDEQVQRKGFERNAARETYDMFEMVEQW